MGKIYGLGKNSSCRELYIPLYRQQEQPERSSDEPRTRSRGSDHYTTEDSREKSNQRSSNQPRSRDDRSPVSKQNERSMDMIRQREEEDMGLGRRSGDCDRRRDEKKEELIAKSRDNQSSLTKENDQRTDMLRQKEQEVDHKQAQFEREEILRNIIALNKDPEQRYIQYTERDNLIAVYKRRYSITGLDFNPEKALQDLLDEKFEEFTNSISENKKKKGNPKRQIKVWGIYFGIYFLNKYIYLLLLFRKHFPYFLLFHRVFFIHFLITY